AAFARSPNGGLIVTSGGTAFHRNLIISLAARHRLPAVYPYRYYSTAGGLISYGPNTIEPVHRAASYVDRILKGEKPADLPVQAPIKYELAINLKTAKALGLTVPDTAPVGRRGLEELLRVVADPRDKRVPELVRACLAALGSQLLSLKKQILEFDRMILAWHRCNQTSKRLNCIPGVGPLLATALVASVGDPKSFRSGRNFSA